MKILVGNNQLGNPGGSETYAYTLIEELVRLGHDVTALAGGGTTGVVSDNIQKLGVNCVFGELKGTFDVAFLSHQSAINRAKNVKAFKIQTCHGVYPAQEQPCQGMNAYVAISEEVQNHLNNLKYKSSVILNGINVERYKSTTSLNNQLKTIVSLAHGNKANVFLQQICDELSIKLIKHNKFGNWTWDMVPIINSGDMIVSLGRGAYESMACSRNVIIYDQRTYANNDNLGDGFVTNINVNDYLKNNCSGRYSKNTYTYETLKQEILKYDPSEGKRLREFVINNMNIRQQVTKYIKLIR